MMQAPPTQALPLRDIKLPAEPGFWPLAPGWWVLIVVLVLLAVWVTVKWYKYSQKKRRWQQIDQQLSALEFDFRQTKDTQKLLTEVSVFLRRFVKYQLQQGPATSLAGHAWISHLNHHQPGAFDAFESVLTHGVFESECEYDPQQLLQTTRHFIQQQVMRPSKMKTQELQGV